MKGFSRCYIHKYFGRNNDFCRTALVKFARHQAAAANAMLLLLEVTSEEICRLINSIKSRNLFGKVLYFRAFICRALHVVWRLDANCRSHFLLSTFLGNELEGDADSGRRRMRGSNSEVITLKAAFPAYRVKILFNMTYVRTIM